MFYTTEFWKCYTKDFDFAWFLHFHDGRDLNIFVERKGFKKEREDAEKSNLL